MGKTRVIKLGRWWSMSNTSVSFGKTKYHFADIGKYAYNISHLVASCGEAWGRGAALAPWHFSGDGQRYYF